MHMYIRISIWIRKPSLDQELKPKKKTNALKVGNTFCKYCIRKGLRKKKKEAVSVLDSEFNNSRLLSIDLAINTNFLACSAVISQQRIVTYNIRA